MATLQDAVLRNAEAAGQQEQEAQRLRDGHREGGAAWLRTELEAKNRFRLAAAVRFVGTAAEARRQQPFGRSSCWKP